MLFEELTDEELEMQFEKVSTQHNNLVHYREYPRESTEYRRWRNSRAILHRLMDEFEKRLFP